MRYSRLPSAEKGPGRGSSWRVPCPSPAAVPWASQHDLPSELPVGKAARTIEFESPRMLTRSTFFFFALSSSVGSPNFIGEADEELISQFLCRAADQTLSQLRQLPADLRLDSISEQSA